jgi:excisionase family DNA binding protein
VTVTHDPVAPRTSSNDSRQLLTIAEAAEMLNVGERFIRRLVAERRIVFRKVGRHIRFRPSDLDNYIESVKHEPPRKRV